MRKTLLATAVIGTLFVPTVVLAEDAPAPASPFSFNVGVVSDYLFRGVTQTHGDPAIQGGIDYAHPSGFYIGAWASNITWVKDWLGDGSVEIDVYGGYRSSFGGSDWTYDVGYITYNYPGHGSAKAWLANPNTQEVYGAIGYKWISAKYSYSTSSHFIGWYGGSGLNEDTRGSTYLEFNANYAFDNGWTLIGHIGNQKVKDLPAISPYNDADYTDWKIGVSKDVGFGVVTLAYSDTNVKGNCSSNAANITSLYCWGDNGSQSSAPTSGFKNVAKGTAVLSFLKTF